MIPIRAVLIGASVLALCGLGVGGVVAGGLQQSPPQDARPADPVGDVVRSATPVEAAPAGAPAPAAPIAITPPAPVVVVTPLDENGNPIATELPAETPLVAEAPEEKIVQPDTPLPRQRRRVAIVEAIDKVTADRMRFEVVVGGRPVRFNNSLTFSARACEVTAENEPVQDAVAYLDVTLQPKGSLTGETRQIFRGWMFASTPAISGLQHPIYDAWVVGCKA